MIDFASALSEARRLRPGCALASSVAAAANGTEAQSTDRIVFLAFEGTSDPRELAGVEVVFHPAHSDLERDALVTAIEVTDIPAVDAEHLIALGIVGSPAGVDLLRFGELLRIANRERLEALLVRVNVQYRDIASIRIHGVPQGEPGPGLVFTPAGVGQTFPLDLVESQLPLPLPAPMRQPFGCDHGGDLIVRLRSGRTITYGPCTWPWQISELWGAMQGIANLVGTDARTTHLQHEITSACATHPKLC